MTRHTTRAIRLVAAVIAATVTTTLAAERHEHEEAKTVAQWLEREELDAGRDAVVEAAIGDTQAQAENTTTPADDDRARQYRHLVRATALDLYGTGRVSTRRARTLAQALVLESYRQRVPLPLLIGIMRVENPEFKSRARSSVGAIGLMQIMPKVWLPVFGHLFGRDLEDDGVNIRFGAAVLKDNLASSGGDWQKALLRYNGCVRGTNTPNCWTYPAMVRRAVENNARWVCRDLEFQECLENKGMIPDQAQVRLATRVMEEEGR